MSARARWQEAYEPRRGTATLISRRCRASALEPAYGPEDWPGTSRWREIGEVGWPGEFPYTRGPYASMYRTKLWTMRLFAGFGTADDTNARFHEFLRSGSDGLSVAFDLPTLMGRDSDDPRCEGEVGKCGVAVDTLADAEDLFAGIDLGEVTTSMTINSPAPILLAMYVAAAEKAGVARARLGGTLQNDMLKEYQAQKEYVFPPRPSVRLVTDVIAFCHAEMPRFHPVSVSGYHIREAGSTAAQELAFTLANGFAYVEAAITRGLDVDEFAPRLSFFFNAHLDFFEEIAKYRAARRIWARWMRDRYKRERPEVAAAALPHPDRRRVPHGPATRGEHRPHGDRGTGRCARRDPESPHELDGRGARSSDGESRTDSASNPAGHRARDRRAPRSPIRSAARGSSSRSPTSSSDRPRRSFRRLDDLGKRLDPRGGLRRDRLAMVPDRDRRSRLRHGTPDLLWEAGGRRSERLHRGKQRATPADPPHRSGGRGRTTQAPGIDPSVTI